MPTAYSYLRFSTPEQMKGDSMRRQSDLALSYLSRRPDLVLDETLTFQDLGVSAWQGKNAEAGQLGAFRKAVEDGLVERGSFLLVESLDRLSRRVPRKAIRILEDIVELGVTVVTLNDHREYTRASLDKDPTALMMTLLTFIRAHEESETKSKRVRAAWQAKRDKIANQPLTAVCPSWLELDPLGPDTKRDERAFRVKPREAKVVQGIFQSFLAGNGIGMITTALNSQKVPVLYRMTRNGPRKPTKWHPSYINRLLDNEAVLGTFTPYRRQENAEGETQRVAQAPIPNYFPAIIDRETFLQVQALRAKKSAKRGKHAKEPLYNLFGGLTVCSRCGSAMRLDHKGAHKGVTYRYFLCSSWWAGAGCVKERVPYSLVEDAFLEAAPELLAQLPSTQTNLEKERTGLLVAEGELKEMQGRVIKELLRKSSSGLRDKLQEIEADLEETTKRLQELDEELAKTAPRLLRPRLGELKKELKAKPLNKDKANALMRTLFAKVSLEFDSGEAVVQWVHGAESRFTWKFPGVVLRTLNGPKPKSRKGVVKVR